MHTAHCNLDNFNKNFIFQKPQKIKKVLVYLTRMYSQIEKYHAPDKVNNKKSRQLKQTLFSDGQNKNEMATGNDMHLYL